MLFQEESICFLLMVVPAKRNCEYSRGLISNVFGTSSVIFLKLAGPAAIVLSTYNANSTCSAYFCM